VVVVCGGLAALLVIGITTVPVPFRSQAQGVVWLAEQSAVRAAANGFFAETLVPDGAQVAKGTPLIKSFDPMLDAEIQLAEARVAELASKYQSAFVENRAAAEIVAEQLHKEEAALARSRERAEDLIVRAGTGGVFRMPQAGDWVGRYHRKGELLGYIVDSAQPVLRVVVEQRDADQVRLATDRVEVRLAGSPERAVPGRVLRQVPAGENHLPSRVLAREGGGVLAVDPTDASGTRTLARTFQLDVVLAETLASRPFGERAYVRFELQKAPLARQWYRAIRRLLLTRFSV
jgi:putative peptide zinc metalloprotease protein